MVKAVLNCRPLAMFKELLDKGISNVCEVIICFPEDVEELTLYNGIHLYDALIQETIEE